MLLIYLHVRQPASIDNVEFQELDLVVVLVAP